MTRKDYSRLNTVAAVFTVTLEILGYELGILA